VGWPSSVRRSGACRAAGGTRWRGSPSSDDLTATSALISSSPVCNRAGDRAVGGDDDRARGRVGAEALADLAVDLDQHRLQSVLGRVIAVGAATRRGS